MYILKYQYILFKYSTKKNRDITPTVNGDTQTELVFNSGIFLSASNMTLLRTSVKLVESLVEEIQLV